MRARAHQWTISIFPANVPRGLEGERPSLSLLEVEEWRTQGGKKKKKDLNKSARFFIPLSLPPSSLPPPDSPLPSSPPHTEAMGVCLTWSSCTPLKLHPRGPPLTAQLTTRSHGRGCVPCALRWSAGLWWVGGHVGPGQVLPLSGPPICRQEQADDRLFPEGSGMSANQKRAPLPV